MLGLAPNYERLKEVPSDETNGIGVVDVGDQYARGNRSSYALANWIRSQGYNSNPYPGPSAGAVVLIPPAIASGLGELGKHGSLISRRYGAGIRLAGVTTDMPLVATRQIASVQTSSAPPVRSAPTRVLPEQSTQQKQMVRGMERWYVDFDKCIPFFAEAASCGLHAECPFTRPTVRPKLLSTMARRVGQAHSQS